MRIVVPDDFPPFYQERPEALEPLQHYGEVALYTTRWVDRSELLARLRGATVAINIRAYTRFDAELLEALPDLRMIAILGTGTDNVDLTAAAERGVVVSNVPGASTVSVAEHTVALMFAVARGLPGMDHAMREGTWRQHLGFELRGKTLGILGLGLIGQEVAKIAMALGMCVIAWSFTANEDRARACGARLVGRDELLRTADVISIHLRASPQTAGLIGAHELGLMKPGAILINTARGAIVDEQALCEALRSRRIAGAGLDVFAQEPLPSDSPLRTLPNVVLTPHAGLATREATDRLARYTVENVIAWLEGRPQHVVTSAVKA